MVVLKNLQTTLKSYRSFAGSTKEVLHVPLVEYSISHLIALLAPQLAELHQLGRKFIRFFFENMLTKFNNLFRNT